MASSEERLDKILANLGYGTRKDVRRLLHGGTVCINGEVVTDASFHVHTDRDTLSVDGENVRFRTDVYLMMNKCSGVVSANKDGLHGTVFDLLANTYRTGSCGNDLHVIGRLDLDTEGLLLLTTDGALTHRLISPKTHIGKTYFIRLRDAVSGSRRTEYVKRFAAGIHIEPEDNELAADCKSAELEWAPTDTLSAEERPDTTALLTIYEGKYHQVKRMFAALGNKVVYLKRIAIGQLKLDETLEPGAYRELAAEELSLLN